MRETTFTELFGKSWGVLSDKRREAEGAPYGKFGEVLEEAIEEKFYDIHEAAEVLELPTDKTRDALHPYACKVRMVRQGQKFLYLKEDVDQLKAEMDAAKIEE